MLEKIKAWAANNPKLAQWIREGGLFVIVSNVITVFKWALLSFLPAAFAFMGSRDFGFPGIDLNLLGIEFKWYIIGYGAEQGGIAYFTAYMIAMVVAFYFFRERNWVNCVMQLLWLAIINLEILGGLSYEITLFGSTFFFPQQGFALLALVPIWLYRGNPGLRSPVLKWTNYFFYPVHLLILGLLAMIL